MFLKEYLEKLNNKKIKLYVDMDGVIADFDLGVPSGYDKKRPLYTSLKKLEEISKMNNVELYILSVTRMDEGFEEKNVWLDKYAPFFKKENRVILSRESNNFEISSNLKANYLKTVERDDCAIVLIDDCIEILKKVRKTNKDVYLLKDTALVD